MSRELLTKSEEFFKLSLHYHRTYSRYVKEYNYSKISSLLYLADIAYYRLNEKYCDYKKNGKSFAKEIRCKNLYSQALAEIADDIKNNFCRGSLTQAFYYKEMNVIPRLKMYEIAMNRYRLKMTYKRTRSSELLDLHNSEDQMEQFVSRFESE